MKTYTLFLGCNIPVRVPQYEMSAKSVLSGLGVKILEIREFNCCGYPMQNIDQKAFLLSSARNLALSEKEHLDMMVLCKCCFGSLKKAEYLLNEDAALKDEVNGVLAKEGLKYEGKTKVNHFLSVLFNEVGVNSIKEKIKNPHKDVKIATHYGCHALRPSKVTQFDDPVNPVLFDSLVEATGAKSIDWQLKLECCGAPMIGVNDELADDILKKKVSNALNGGADYMCTACPYCHMQFDNIQKMDSANNEKQLPTLLFPQLLGLSMGINKDSLGIGLNQINVSL
ncbi:MAG: CoB--CoM heterodisulfide reductase iron-sulfur subunit B family protein [Desulfobacterales bacterium]|nr:CoB--CoM heterodisulfide reductase iron-sulfur subunit B family protein [Desulfobacterales bacterium]